MIGAGVMLFLLALGLRLYLAKGLAGPLDNDSSDYFLVARSLAAGRGFVEDVVWNFHAHPAGVTHPSNDYWMPLASILMALSMLIFGNSFVAAEVPNLLLGAALPLVGMAVARELGARKTYAGLAGLLLAVGPRLFLYSIDTDAVMAYSFFGGLAWLGTVRGSQGRILWLIAAGFAAGLCHLGRNDGSIWALAMIGVFTLSRRQGEKASAPFRHWLAAAGAYLLVIGPWLIRNLAVFGTPLPPTSGQAIFFHRVLDLYAFDTEFSLHTYLAQGAAAIAASKVAGLVTICRSLIWEGALTPALFPLTVLGVALASPPARRVTLAHLGLVILLWSAVMDVYAASGFGGTVRTAASLAVYLVPAAMLGLDRIEQWVQKRLPLPAAVLPALAVALAGWLAFSVLKTKTELQEFSRGEWAYFHQVGRSLKSASPSPPTVMSFRPWQFNLAEDLPAVSIPSDGLNAILAAGRKYRVEFLILDNYWARDLIEFRAPVAYLTKIHEAFSSFGRLADPDFIPDGRFGDTLIFRLAPAAAGSDREGSP